MLGLVSLVLLPHMQPGRCVYSVLLRPSRCVFSLESLLLENFHQNRTTLSVKGSYAKLEVFHF